MNKKALLLSLIFFSSVTFSNSQIKKAFKKVEKGRYFEALNIFNSDDYKNTAAGCFGTALIYNSPDFKWNGYKYKRKANLDDLSVGYLFRNKNIPMNYKYVSYKFVLRADKLYPSCNKRTQRKVKNYFSKDKLQQLKNSLENYFLNLNNEHFLLVYDSLLTINKADEFSKKLNNKYVLAKYEQIKSNKRKTVYKKISKIELLTKKYPNSKNTTILTKYVDSMNFKYNTNNISGIAKTLKKYPNTSYKKEIFKKIDNFNSKKTKGEKIFVLDKANTKEETLKKQLNLAINNNDIFILKLNQKQKKELNISENYLIYTLPYQSQTKDVLYLLKNKLQKYKNVFCYNLLTGVQIYDKNKVFKYGKLLNEYKTIVLMGDAEYFEYGLDVTSNLKKYKSKLEKKCDYNVIMNELGKYEVIVNIKDNPYSVKLNLKSEIPVSKFTEQTSYVGFIKNGKKPHILEIGEFNSNTLEYIKTNAKKYFETK